MDERTIKILKSIIKHCNVINETIDFFGKDYNNYKDNSIYQNALLTPVTQIGELVKKISIEVRNQYTQIPWKNIAGMRDIVVHNYENIDKDILWDVANSEIGKIKEECKKIVNGEI